jgi:hypothetical protein
MAQAVTDFVRNSGLLGLLNLLTVAIFVLIGLLRSLVSRSSRRMSKRLAWGMVPLLIGLVTMCVYYSTSDRGMFGTPGAEQIAANRRDALIHGVIGVLGTAVFVATGMLGRKGKIGNGG